MKNIYQMLQKNSKYHLNLNEIASGDMRMFMNDKANMQSNKSTNALAQIFLSILSLHNLGYYHNDAHTGNFLYHRIKPGGYIKHTVYGENLYLENMGYLWVIWDFGRSHAKDDEWFLSDYPTFYYDIEYLRDYFRIINGFMNVSSGITGIKGWVDDDTQIHKDTKDIVQTIFDIRSIMVKNKKQLEKTGLRDIKNQTQLLEKTFFREITKQSKLFIKEDELPPGAKIINNDNPYNITTNDFGVKKESQKRNFISF